MRVRTLVLSATLALAAPAAVQAADLAGYIPVPIGPNCSGLQPEAVYVPPQTAYIVACTVALTPTGLFNPQYNEGKLVYFKEWRPARPPVHMLVVPR